jgi:hypothetical protein
MDDFFSFLKTVAPTIAGFVGTPAIGVATEALIKAFDGDDTKVQSIIAGNAQLSSEDIAKIKIAEIEAKSRKDELGLAFAKLDVEDVKSARDSAVGGGVSKHIFYMSLMILGAAIGTDVYVLVNGLPEGLDEMVVGKGLGFLENVSMMVIGYWYGTSHGSQAKTEMMAKSK